jgi:hypothetical protein
MNFIYQKIFAVFNEEDGSSLQNPSQGWQFIFLSKISVSYATRKHFFWYYSILVVFL